MHFWEYISMQWTVVLELSLTINGTWVDTQPSIQRLRFARLLAYLHFLSSSAGFHVYGKWNPLNCKFTVVWSWTKYSFDVNVEVIVCRATQQLRSFEAVQAFFDLVEWGESQNVEACFIVVIKRFFSNALKLWILCWIMVAVCSAIKRFQFLRSSRCWSSETLLRTCVTGSRSSSPISLSTKADTNRAQNQFSRRLCFLVCVQLYCW